MNFATRALLELQETTLLFARALRGIFKRPRYIPETIAQMDAIGVGSLTIIILTGFFTGGVLTVQTFPTLKSYGAQSQTGYLVAVSLVRELGPVLCALMVTGRVGSAISAELGSMVVSQQIDAMRALGTDPIRKLVAPRLWALLVSLPLLTVLADVLGIFGRALVPLLIGAIAGSALGLRLHTWLPIYEAGGASIPGIVPLSAISIVLFGLLAATGPARRAIRVDPTEALRVI